MDFQNYLQENARKIDQELEDFYQKWRKEVGGIDSKLLPLLDLAIDASTGGKRLRAVLIRLGYQIAGGKQNLGELLKPAAAYEIFQTAILAHDDVIDRSPLRRGKKTIYQSLGAGHYAISQAICLGDIGFFLAFQIFAESGFDPKLKNQAIAFFAKSMLETGFGQMLDVELPRHEMVSEEDIIAISKYKTAWYTIVGPLTIGAILAGAEDGLLEDIKFFGENLGVAYQIQDDILGIIGEEEVLGKSVTSDVEEGKLTLIYLKALEKANLKQKELLNLYYGKGKVTKENFVKIKLAFEETGAIDYARQQAVKYVSQAKKQIPEITKDQYYRKMLAGLAEYLINREK